MPMVTHTTEAARNGNGAKAAFPAPDPELRATLRKASLRYSRPSDRGYRREGDPKAFRYLDADGRRVRRSQVLARIRALVIPPAWTSVWICEDPQGHLQATGRDARGRLQYRYHPQWRAQRDEHKFDRLAEFAAALPSIRDAVDHDLAQSGLTRRKLLAAMVRLLDRTYVRVGDERYRRENGSFGLTTLRNRHVQVRGDRIRLRFRGKSGKEHDLALSDRRLARVVRRCLDLPGYELFRYVEDGETRPLCATDVNEYLQEIAGADYTSKDFRTWGATVIATVLLTRYGLPGSISERTKTVNRALRSAAQTLGNTLAVCRKSYVHPGVVEAYLADVLPRRRVSLDAPGLRASERRTLALLRTLRAPVRRSRPRARSRAVASLAASPP
ncbi:MAG TPA: DNA topoisomerase IB [Casimicrobiaceae bacterium]|nr:DNA topoisomerase IB [Casimicrobiaceae bacterium]